LSSFFLIIFSYHSIVSEYNHIIPRLSSTYASTYDRKAQFIPMQKTDQIQSRVNACLSGYRASLFVFFLHHFCVFYAIYTLL
jgi:hypothetical protein